MWPRRLVVFTCEGLLPPSKSGSRLWMPRALGVPAPAEWNNRVKKKNREEGGERGGEGENQMTERLLCTCEWFFFPL